MVSTLVGLVMLMSTILEVSPDVQDWANQLGLDPMDLQGAVNTTGLSPVDYLTNIGVIRPKLPDPYTYLYQTYPHIASRMDCVISRESRWSPGATNPTSGAAGLIQALPSTWANLVPYSVKLGRSPYDPYAAIDAGAYLQSHYGWSQWQVITQGLC